MFVGIASNQVKASESAIKQKRRVKIKEVAKKLFIEQGIHDTSMQQIADTLGMGRRTIYHYYDTKEEIAIEIQQEFLGILQMIEGLEAKVSRFSSGLEKIEALLNLLLSHYLKHIDQIEYLNEFDRVFKHVEGYGFTTPRLEDYNVYNSFHAAIQSGIQDGSIRPMMEKEVSNTILTINHALFALIIRIVSREEIIKKMYDYDITDIQLITKLFTQGFRR
ncbi:TetR/AcrR family transcriptional regulator [Paenibacillus alkaliterrae]|uniref:TetR/AcrR family transcriptional regulator n=1 Tax=Paenibacillus alkaliterrae TaxID=320909 RepID=UPI001F217217|nr:TetR/AcrR family transcriptional regulator [Paenibacillus alkaliterrae]MCF2939524.1 TetR/AcrR family transcriptional regulator [Paenibacillus alkaliterrae]